MENLELFEIKLEKNKEKIENTNIEYVQLAFSDDGKKRFFKLLEGLIKYNEVYEDYLLKLLEKENEKNNS